MAAGDAARRWAATPTPHTHVRAGFHVPYEVRDSRFGKGLFALCDIPAGTLLWKIVGGKEGEPGARRARARVRGVV